MMTVSEQLYQQAQQLPENMQLEVLHYLQFLREKTARTEQIDEIEPNERSERLYRIMSEAAKRGTVFENMDVLAWQKEQRKDRPLPFRE